MKIPEKENKPEVWLRGHLPAVPALLQPIAHALLQAREEVAAYMNDFPEHLLWQRPAQVAAVGFHLQHLSGVLDRLFTYARQESLNEKQLAALAAEGKPGESAPGKEDLLLIFNRQVDRAIEELINTDLTKLTEFRGVGRAHLPSTVMGLLVHAAEHTQRHVGQLLVTARILVSLEENRPS
ncbi:MAG: metal-dependent hydrolase [Adhaeribacter sp.]|nr:metal-dependent hydrolase [Adhaeribacter sp.]